MIGDQWSSQWFSNNTWSTLARLMALRRLAPSHHLGQSNATMHITYIMVLLWKRYVVLLHLCAYVLNLVFYMHGKCIFNELYESIFQMILCHMSCKQTSIFRGISNHNEWTTEVWLFIECENPWYSSHSLVINVSFWKLSILIWSSLTVTSVGCFRMPSSSLKHTGPTHDTCLENALMAGVSALIALRMRYPLKGVNMLNSRHS